MAALFRNAGWSGAAAGLRAASGLVNALLAIRLLGSVEYGHVATALSLFVLYLSLNSSIFTALVVKLMAPDAVGEKHAVLIASSSIFSVISMSMLVLVTLFLRELAPRLMSIDPGNFLDTEIRRAILLMGALTAIQILVSLHSALIESGGRLDLAMKWQLIGPLVVLTSLAILFFMDMKVTTSGYVAILCAGAFTDLLLLWLVKRKVMSPIHLEWSIRKHLAGLEHLLKSGGVLQATSLMNMFLEPLNKFLLNHFVGASAVTVYDLAMKVIWGVQHLFGSAMRVFLHLASQNEKSVGVVFCRVITLIGVPALIFHAMAALCLSWIGHYWLGINVAQLMIFFTIATLSNLGMIYITPLYISLIGRNDLHFIFRCQVILAVTNASVSLVLIPYVGLIGAAFGLLAATAYNCSAIYRRCKAKSGTFDGIENALRKTWPRYLLSTGLFIAVIQVGVTGGGDFVSILLFCGLAVILLREPLVGYILNRMGFA